MEAARAAPEAASAAPGNRGPPGGASKTTPWPRPKMPSTRSSTSSSRGRSRSCRSASGRSTFTACIPTSGSSSRSSSKSSSAATSTGGTRPRPVRGLGHDARPGARERARRHGDRPRRLQLPADAGQDRALQPVHPRTRPPRRARAIRARGGDRSAATRGTSAEWFAPEAAAELLRFRLAARRVRARRRSAGRARARGTIRAAHHALRPRLPESPAGRAVLVPQAQARVPARSSARPTSFAATRSTRWTRLKEFARVRKPGEAQVIHGDARVLDAGYGFDAVVTSPPYPGLIDYHEQHRYAYELLDLDDLRERELGAAANGHESRGARPLRRRSGCGARASAGVAAPGRAAPDRRRTTGESSIRRSWSVRRCGSTAAIGGTSTAAPVAGRASTSKTCSSHAARSRPRQGQRATVTKL